MRSSEPEGAPRASLSLPGREFLCSSVAGVGATLITHPLDTWAVHRQTGRPLPAHPSGFFRGLGPAAVQGALIYGSLIGCFETFYSWGMPLAIAAAASAIPESAVRGPLEALKNLQQTGRTQGGWRLARTLGKGTMGTLAREIPGNTIYFCTYTWVRSHDVNPWLTGALTGAAYTVVCQPIESMRAQLVTGKALRPTFQGSGPYFMRSVLITAFVQYFYEKLLGHKMGGGS
jgi:hypothetical protein